MSDVSGDEFDDAQFDAAQFDAAQFDAFKPESSSGGGQKRPAGEMSHEEEDDDDVPPEKKFHTSDPDDPADSDKGKGLAEEPQPVPPQPATGMMDEEMEAEPEAEPEAKPEMTFIQPQQAMAQDNEEEDDQLYAKTMNVKDFGNVLTGCCSVPGVDFVILTFDPQGMQLYAKPIESPSIVTAFFNKDMFTEYRVTKQTRRILDKTRLDSLKKKISKEVEFLEISSCTEYSGYTFSGYRIYKTGGKCKFTVNIANIHNPIGVVDLSDVDWAWHLRTSSQKFKDNVDFIDDSNEFIRMTIRSKSMEFQGIRDTGQIGETIDQEAESKIEDKLKFEALFYKKYLKIITSTKDLNRSVNISFNLDNPDTPAYPVHFSYELDQASPQSHFSAYLLPFTTDS